ncbi:phosphomevalonate kinase, peroxisomal-like [Hibiscus syriacus]|uniref:phosphomevalonate kinase, peroxisomal-like n=1 Tax=Hibiscus syriacus TaxID=106335 RepID=UPI00192313E8|nr:phosphomevalonate kinase, peroxisomal-like [Hibiscus syriacus]
MEVVASAPGKVLLTGGYLILERPNAGIVLSTKRTFRASTYPAIVVIISMLLRVLRAYHVQFDANSLTNAIATFQWRIMLYWSPQLSRESMYKLSRKHLTLQCVSSSESRNLFVENAIQYTIAAAYATFDKNKKDALDKLLLQGLDITILCCNDFYSYRGFFFEALGLPLAPEALATLPHFTSITFNSEESHGGNCKPEVAETGLDSSAAMTTAVVAALLHYLGVINLSTSSEDQHRLNKNSMDLDIMHMIAQSAHCIAQGKVGSGFDVSFAVYGSQCDVCFSPEVLSAAQAAVKGMPLEEVIRNILNGKWDHERTEFSVPPLMTLLLGEPATGGSSTPSMVGAVKKWQKADPEKSQETWIKLAKANSELEIQLNMLRKLAEEHWDAYKCVNVIDRCSRLKQAKFSRFILCSLPSKCLLPRWSTKPIAWTVVEGVTEPIKEAVVKALLREREGMLEIQNRMRTMGEDAGIPIEPESQTQLLDATMNMEGVLLAGVPGAGGFDAVFAVTLRDSSRNVTNAWSSHNVLALLVREDPQGVCFESGDTRCREILRQFLPSTSSELLISCFCI